MAVSEKGYLTEELWPKWWAHFQKYRRQSAGRPLLLTCDGYGAHCYDFNVLREAEQERIIITAFPSHTSSLLQPLDVAVFGPLKQAWKRTASVWFRENPGKVITRTSFPWMSRQAWKEGITVDTVKSGFKATGIWPFDVNFVSKVELKLRVSTALCTTALPIQKDEQREQSLRDRLGLSPRKPQGIQRFLVVPQREAAPQKRKTQRENTTEPRELTSLTRIEALEKQEQERKEQQQQKEQRKEERKRKREEKENEKQEKKKQKIEQNEREKPIIQLFITKGYMKEGERLTVPILTGFFQKNDLGRFRATREEKISALLGVLSEEPGRVWL